MLGDLVSSAIDRRGAIMTGVVVLALAATITASHLELDALPDVTTNQVLVLTTAPGLTPVEVEELVTRRVEAATGGLAGVETTRSLSRYGISSVTLVFGQDVDPWLARQIVNERLAALATELPPGVDAPALGPLSGGLGEVYHLILRSPRRDKAELLELAELRASPLLRSVRGVVEVNTWGGAQRTFELRADPERLAAAHLTLDDLATQMGDGLGRVAGAALPVGRGQALLRARSQPRSPEALGQMTIRTPDGAVLPLGSLGTLTQGELPRTGSATVDGQGEAVYIMVQMLRDANALELCERLEGRIAEVRTALPADVQVDVIYDRAVLVRATLATVAKNLAEGGLLVITVLFAMLGSLRAGILVAMVIPLSMLGALAGMVVLDLPGNLMSLGAIDFGLLVDGAVVIVEALFHDVSHQGEHGGRDLPWRERVRQVARRASRPVFFAVLVIALVYAPIVALGGVDGRMFRPMALVVILALLTSLALALAVVPAAATFWLRPKDVPAGEPLLVRALRRVWQPVFSLSLKVPALVAALALASLGLGAWLLGGAGSEFVPQLDEGDLVIQTERSPDISIESAVVAAGKLEAALRREIPEVQRVTSRVGSPAVATDIMGLEQADVFVGIAPRDGWRPGLEREALIAEVAAVVAKFDPTAEIALTQPIQMRFNELLGGAVSDVTAEVYGQELDALRHSAERMAMLLQAIPGVVDVRVLTPPDVPMLEVTPDSLAAARHGFDNAAVLQAVTALRVGIAVGSTLDGLVEVPVRLRIGASGPQMAGSAADPASSPVAGAAIEHVRLPTAQGALVPLSRIASIRRTPTPSRISHDEGQRRVVVGFNVRGTDLGGAVEAAQRAVAVAQSGADSKVLDEGQRLVWGGQHATLQAARQRMAVVLPITLALVLATLILGFGATRPALLVLSHVPFAVVGGAIAMTWRGMPLSISALIGFIALSGIAVLNGVVLVSRVRELEADGLPGDRAIVLAVGERLRPVMTTALVAALGFVPMMLATGTGAEVQRPLATVVVGGLVTSTTVTLLVLPTIYAALARRRGARA